MKNRMKNESRHLSAPHSYQPALPLAKRGPGER